LSAAILKAILEIPAKIARRIAPFLPEICGAFLILNGLLALLGWVLGISVFTGGVIIEDYPVNPLTALLFAIFGLALITLRRLKLNRRMTFAGLGGGMFIAVGIARLIDALFSLHTGFDRWFLHDLIVQRGIASVGIPPIASFALIALGAAFILITDKHKKRQSAGQYLATVVIVMAVIVFNSRLYEAPSFARAVGSLPLSMSSALNFIAASTGILALRPHLGFVGILTAPNLGGVTARRLFPLIIFAPPLLGLLCLYLGRLSIFDPAGALGVVVMFTVLVLVSAFLATCYRLENTAHDLTERGRELEIARRGAESASRAKSEFLANMSHELRTPLNAVIGFSEILRDARFGPLEARYREYAGDILDSGFHLLALVNNILDLAKVEARQLDLIEDWTDLHDLAGTCLNIVREKAAHGGIRMTSHIGDDFPLVLMDRTRMKQVLLNLLSNAVKFTPPGGTVTLTALAADGCVAISVRDTGVGMDASEIQIAFMPFRQIDSTLARQYEGTGLGLPLARALVELHDGELTLDSARGEGTTATIRLPPSRIGDSPQFLATV
jgi:signal transduction histidine kinase